jgi:hypothetical protein
MAVMLGPLSSSSDRQQALGIALQARIWWYQSRLGVEIPRDGYEAYCLSSGGSSRPDAALVAKIDDIRRRMAAAEDQTPASSGQQQLPAWQTQAPKADLRVKADDGITRDDSGGQDAPYPEHFRAIIEAVTTGKAVSGVREIPNTVVRQAVRATLSVPTHCQTC